MRLIADSGSTKTDWSAVDDRTIVHRFVTAGLNPCHQSENDIMTSLTEEVVPNIKAEIIEVCFYGSGVRQDKEELMCRLLAKAFPGATKISAHSDMLGAARALCGDGEGIACILGTGANTCLYDGSRIVANTPALGYILGDEGSGAVMGRLFLNAIYKGTLPETLKEELEQWLGMSLSDIIDRVYRQPMANRFLASLSPFIHSHLNVDGVREIVIDNFRAFFSKNIAPYQRRDLRVNALGSIAYHYSEELKTAARLEGYEMGSVIKSPFDSRLWL